MNSGCGTYRRNDSDAEFDNTQNENEDYSYVYNDQVEECRNVLDIGNDEKLLTN